MIGKNYAAIADGYLSKPDPLTSVIDINSGDFTFL